MSLISRKVIRKKGQETAREDDNTAHLPCGQTYGKYSIVDMPEVLPDDENLIMEIID